MTKLEAELLIIKNKEVELKSLVEKENLFNQELKQKLVNIKILLLFTHFEEFNNNLFLKLFSKKI